MTRSVVLAARATAAPMGQQRYEEELHAALEEHGGERWSVTLRPVSPFRSHAPGAVRVPLRAVEAAPGAVAALAGAIAYRRPDLVHRLDLRLPPAGGREVLTIHDLPPLRFEDEGRLPHWAAWSARRALGVVCPSRFAANEVSQLLGVRRTWVIPYGVNEAFFTAAPLTPQELEAYGLRGRFVLHIAGATARKNLAPLAEAWRRVAEVEPETTLALCGPPDGRRDALFEGIPGARYLGRLPFGDVPRLVKTAAAVVVPSVYEGFGLPLLEAMAAGTPALAAARGALPEVAGDAAVLVEPTGDGLAEGLLAVLRGGELPRRLRHEGPARARTFTWRRAAKETLAAYEEAVAA